MSRTLAKEPSDAVARENLISVYFSQAQMAEQDHNRTLARDRWTMAWKEAQHMVQRDASAKSYVTDYQALEEMGLRLGELKSGQ